MSIITLSNKGSFTALDINPFLENYFKSSIEIPIFDLRDFTWISLEGLTLLNSIFNDRVLYNKSFKILIELNTASDFQLDERLSFLNFLINTWNLHSNFKAPERYFDVGDPEKYISSTLLRYKKKGIEKFVHETPSDYLFRVKSKINSESGILNYRYFINNIGFIEWKKVLGELKDINNVSLNNSINDGIIPKDLSLLTDLELNGYVKNSLLKDILLREVIENSIIHGRKNDDISCYTSLGIGYKGKNYLHDFQPEIHDFIAENQNFLEICNIDFGRSIPLTLEEDFSENSNIDLSDSNILKYAFEKTSSSKPYEEDIKDVIPRGLSDVLLIVKSFRGLIVIRSRTGYLCYNFFSKPEGELKLGTSFFPGTMTTIFLPKYSSNFEKANFDHKSFEKPKYIRNQYINLGFLEHQGSIINKPTKAIESFFKKIRILEERYHKDVRLLIVLDFSFLQDSYIIEKLLLLLVTSPNLENSSFIVVNPRKDSINRIQKRLLEIRTLRLDFILRPLPCYYLDDTQKRIDFVGVFNEADKDTLKKVLYYSKEFKNISETSNPFNDGYILGNIVYKDKNNSLNVLEILDQELRDKFDIINVSQNFFKTYFTKSIGENLIYLTPGGYFQREFCYFLDDFQLNTKYIIGDVFIRLFYNNEVFKRALNNGKIVIITKTLSSHILGDLILNKVNSDSYGLGFEALNHIKLPNYYENIETYDFSNLNSDDHIFVISDVVGSGNSIIKIQKQLNKINLSIESVFCLIDVRTSTDKKVNDFGRIKVEACYSKEIIKYSINEVHQWTDYQIIRASPYTNTLIKEESNRNQNILFEFQDLCSQVPFLTNYIIVNYIKRNNAFFTYYINTKSLFQQIDHGSKILKLFLKKIKMKGGSLPKFRYIVFPSNSGINKNSLESLYKEDYIHPLLTIHKLTREKTEGESKYINLVIELEDLENEILLIDDGSCTGATLMQMLESLRFISKENIDNPQIKIVVLSLFGRLNSHNKSQFSSTKLLQIRDTQVEVEFYFGTQLYINTYFQHSFSFVVEEKIRLQNERYLPRLMTLYIDKRKNELENANFETVLTNINWFDELRESKLFEISEFIFWRNELGKLLSHKNYIDDFKNFNSILIQYYSDQRSLCYKSLDYILLAIYHEQFFALIIEKNLPDLFIILKDYIKSVLMGNPFFFERKNIAIMSSIVIIFFKIETILLNFKDYEDFFKSIRLNKISLGKFFYFSWLFFKTSKINEAIYNSNKNLINIIIPRYIKVEEEDLPQRFKLHDLYEVEKILQLFPFNNSGSSEFEKASQHFERYYSDKRYYKTHRNDLEAKIRIVDSLIKNFILQRKLETKKMDSIIDVYLGLFVFNKLLEPFQALIRTLKHDNLGPFLPNEIYDINTNLSICYKIIEKLNTQNLLISNDEINNLKSFRVFCNYFKQIFLVPLKDELSYGEMVFAGYKDLDLIKTINKYFEVYGINLKGTLFFKTHEYIFETVLLKTIKENLISYSVPNSEQILIETNNNVISINFTNRFNGDSTKSGKIGIRDLKKVAEIYGFIIETPAKDILEGDFYTLKLIFNK